MLRQLLPLCLVIALVLLVDVPGWFEAPSPRAIHAERLRDAGTPGAADWIAAGRAAAARPVALDAALNGGEVYTERGRFTGDQPRAVALRLRLQRGERLQLLLGQPAREDGGRLFAELHRREGERWRYVDSLRPGVPVTMAAEGGALTLRLLLQPALGVTSAYALGLARGGSLVFPVRGVGQEAILSGFGAPRDGGRRRHKGVDVFAPRGTAVRAVVDGRAVPGRNRLGGRVLWLHGNDGNRYYYAHLDAVDVFHGQAVEAGEFIARVGNSGNARTTPPHLHFAIYADGGGAVDPAPYLRPMARPRPESSAGAPPPRSYRVVARSLNLRAGPSTGAPVASVLANAARIEVVAASGDWLRVRGNNGRDGFVAARWVEPVTATTAGLPARLTAD